MGGDNAVRNNTLQIRHDSDLFQYGAYVVGDDHVAARNRVMARGGSYGLLGLGSGNALARNVVKGWETAVQPSGDGSAERNVVAGRGAGASG